ncbi:MAG: hypothetical protein ACRDYU_14125 [Actinomycetes bacterium]
MAQSKTSRASVRAGSGAGKGAITFLGEIKFIVPCHGGRYAYVRNVVTGKMPHVTTDSDRFADEVRSLAGAGHAGRLKAEFESLAAEHPSDGWELTMKRLEEAGAFQAEDAA